MDTTIILAIVLIILLLGVAPLYPYNRTWGWGPGGIVGVLLIILLVLAVTGRI